MPLRGTSWAWQRARSTPSNSTVPRVRRASPMIARKVVVLPTPLRPSSAAHSPPFTSRFTPCRMCSLPIWTWTSSSLSMHRLLDVVFVLGAAEVSFTHALVGGDVLRAAGGEDRAQRHHGDVVGDLEHDLHVVLDDHDVDRASELADLADRALGFGRAHAAGRFVEQKEPRRRDERHADLEQRDVAIGERAGLTLGERGEPDLVERALHLLARVAVACGRAERIEESLPGLAGDPEIVRHRQLRDHALDLQRALDAEPADLVRLEPGNVAAVEEH